MKKQFEAGETVFDLYGHAGCYVGEGHAGHLVEPIFEAEDGEDHYGNAESWKEVFREPPVNRCHERIAQLNKEIADQEAKLRAIRDEQRQAERARTEMLQRIKDHPDLTNLDLWLTGSVTHLVKLDYYTISIGTLEEILGRDSDKRMRLLSLYGGTDRHFNWRMAAYADGSGNTNTVLLATSEEHAKQLAAEYIAKEAPTMERRGSGHMRVLLAISALKYGIPISDELKALAEKSIVDQRKTTMDRAMAELKRSQDYVDSLKAQGY